MTRTLAVIAASAAIQEIQARGRVPHCNATPAVIAAEAAIQEIQAGGRPPTGMPLLSSLRRRPQSRKFRPGIGLPLAGA